MTDYSERARIVKLKLSALTDTYISEVLPGAPRVYQETCELIDDLVEAVALLSDSDIAE